MSKLILFILSILAMNTAVSENQIKKINEKIFKSEFTITEESENLKEKLKYSTDSLFNIEVLKKIEETNDVGKINAYKFLYETYKNNCVSKNKTPSLYRYVEKAKNLLGDLFTTYATHQCCHAGVSCASKMNKYCSMNLIGNLSCSGDLC